jgi:hypothetical protein
MCPFIAVSGYAGASAPGASQFDFAARVFRMDAADVSYVFGVNESDQVQMLYSSGFRVDVAATPISSARWNPILLCNWKGWDSRRLSRKSSFKKPLAVKW